MTVCDSASFLVGESYGTILAPAGALMHGEIVGMRSRSLTLETAHNLFDHAVSNT